MLMSRTKKYTIVVTHDSEFKEEWSAQLTCHCTTVGESMRLINNELFDLMIDVATKLKCHESPNNPIP